MRLCEVLGVDRETAAQTYYACLLMYAGCTTDVEKSVQIFRGNLTKQLTHRQFGSALDSMAGIVEALPSPGGPWFRQVYEVATGLPKAVRFRKPHFAAMCEVAEMIAERLGMPRSVQNLFPLLTERWDGRSTLRRARAEEVPLPLRIVVVGRDAAYQRLVGDENHAVSVIRTRAGHAFDPGVAQAFVDNASEILGAADTPESAWEATLAAEPRPWLTLEGEAIDRALAAMGTFADLASPCLAGHSAGVASLAAAAAKLCGFDGSEVAVVRRAGYVQDVGNVAVHPRIFEKAGPLNADEREQVRLHPYYTERVLCRSSFLAPIAAIACAHHERLDGSGYHRGIGAAALAPAARLLAAADAYRSKTEPRSYRRPYSPEQAGSMLADKARKGQLDARMVTAVIEAAGQPAPRIERPAGLTAREVQVLGLVARGMQTKQVAHALDVTVKTADHHIQNAYRKIGVSSRSAATLFAVEHGLVE
jgi:HD-GYP domain-containing protein (c-di-GMP phosphodiesterase class II)